jgi:hypothetical protein
MGTERPHNSNLLNRGQPTNSGFFATIADEDHPSDQLIAAKLRMH